MRLICKGKVFAWVRYVQCGRLGHESGPFTCWVNPWMDGNKYFEQWSITGPESRQANMINSVT